jgi:hypothetical protein
LPSGAYGFRFVGLDPASEGLLPAPADWPRLTIARESRDVTAEGPAPGAIEIDDAAATLGLLHGDRIDIDRASLTVRVATADPLSDEALIHPYLGIPAAIASRWLGRQVLHGGGFAHDGRAWGVLADRAGGKSSTLASLLAHGFEIVTDDLLIAGGTTVFSGPRNIDLRREPAALLGGEPLGFLGARDRWRLRPGAVPPTLPLGGFVHLEWGDELRLEPLEASERLTGLVRQSFSRPGPRDALDLLSLAALPAWRLTRPRRLGELERATAAVLDAIR